MNQSLVAKGSIKDISSGDTAVALMDAEFVILCDNSGSMVEPAKDNKSRHTIANDVLCKLQARYPGKLVVVAFNDWPIPCENGILPPPTGMTYIINAFQEIATLVEMGMRVILITDGEPTDNEQGIIDYAKRQLTGLMDCIYVGPDGSDGAVFLKDLARNVGGEFGMCDLTRGQELLENKITQLLLTAGGSK